VPTARSIPGADPPGLLSNVPPGLADLLSGLTYSLRPGLHISAHFEFRGSPEDFFFRPYGARSSLHAKTHGLRHGLHSFAASRLLGLRVEFGQSIERICSPSVCVRALVYVPPLVYVRPLG